jgi:hypothetical protein
VFYVPFLLTTTSLPYLQVMATAIACCVPQSIRYLFI